MTFFSYVLSAKKFLKFYVKCENKITCYLYDISYLVSFFGVFGQ